MIFLWSARQSEKKKRTFKYFPRKLLLIMVHTNHFYIKWNIISTMVSALKSLKNTTPSKCAITLHTVTSLSAHCFKCSFTHNLWYFTTSLSDGLCFQPQHNPVFHTQVVCTSSIHVQLSAVSAATAVLEKWHKHTNTHIPHLSVVKLCVYQL